MPELPEVETVKNQLIPCIVNKKILSYDIYFPKLRYPISVPPIGTYINKIERRSKYIICYCTQNTRQTYWILHLGMTGHFDFITSKSLELPKHSHVDIIFENGILRYIDPRRFGAMIYTDTLDNNLLNNLGIEPLSISSQELGKYLFDKAQNKKQNIKLFLTNNQIVVGIGNIYACEILFDTKINPNTISCDISLEKFIEIAKNIQSILHHAIKMGGSTIDNFTHVRKDDVQEVNGYFQINHKVYGKENKPCIICNNLILRISQGQRSTFFCQECQKN